MFSMISFPAWMHGLRLCNQSNGSMGWEIGQQGIYLVDYCLMEGLGAADMKSQGIINSTVNIIMIQSTIISLGS